MNRRQASFVFLAVSVPRTRGDEPTVLADPQNKVERSPHPRG